MWQRSHRPVVQRKIQNTIFGENKKKTSWQSALFILSKKGHTGLPSRERFKIQSAEKMESSIKAFHFLILISQIQEKSSSKNGDSGHTSLPSWERIK